MAPVAFPTLNNKEALCVWHSGKERIQRKPRERQTVNEREKERERQKLGE